MTRQNSKNVWVFVELREGKIAPVVLELLGEGKKLAQGLEERLCAVVLSSGTDKSIPEQLSQYGADVVYSVESPLLEHYTTDGYTTAMAELVRKETPAILLFGATHIGRDLAPRLAARLNTGLTADCTSLSLDEETKDLMQTRTSRLRRESDGNDPLSGAPPADGDRAPRRDGQGSMRSDARRGDHQGRSFAESGGYPHGSS